MDRHSIEEQALVERYVTGRLAPDEAAQFEEYFLERPDVAAEVQAAQRLRRGLEAMAAQEAVRTSVALGLWQRLRRSRLAQMAPLLLLAVAMVPLGLQMRRIDQLEANLVAAHQPRINTPIFELTTFRSDPNAPPDYLLTLTPEPEWIVLLLTLPGSEQPSYRVELLDARGQVVWQAEEVQPDALGRLAMTLPSTLLPAGDYEIRVVPSAGDAELGRYRLRVTVGS